MMKKMLRGMSGLLLAVVLMGVGGCEIGGSDDSGLPSNPAIPANPAGTNKELWYFSFKDYDNSFRVRWPTWFFTDRAVGAGSYTLVNDERAEFRNYHIADGGENRPAYTMPGPESRLSGQVRCILVSASGERLAWFETTVGGESQGRLP